MSAEKCTHSIREARKLHPVDCPNCVKDKRCQMRPTMLAHPDKIKSCKFFVGRHRNG